MHAAIRSWLAARYSQEVAEQISILYGGSCNPGNAKALFACPNVDGGLIGGASLKIADFSVLVAEETWTI
jgi:triosephosphate isomerase